MCRVGFLSGRGVAGVVSFPCFSHIFLLVSSFACFFSMCSSAVRVFFFCFFSYLFCLFPMFCFCSGLMFVFSCFVCSVFFVCFFFVVFFPCIL